MSSPAAAVGAIVQAAGPHVPVLPVAGEGRLPEVAARGAGRRARRAEVAVGPGHVLGEHAGATIAAGGKRLRPLLVLLTAGEPERPRDLVRCAAAVERAPSATLAHGPAGAPGGVRAAAGRRGGRPTVWARGGRGMAIAVGDLLFSRAFAEL